MNSGTIEARIAAGDVSLFSAIPSETSVADRRALLALQNAVRRQGRYVYLEIGSHMGGTLQSHYADPACQTIYSIDKRPYSVADERGEDVLYPGNSTERMRQLLTHAAAGVDSRKLQCFDSDATRICPREIREAPDLCFIDGEHTNDATFSDFVFTLSVVAPSGAIAFHDSYIIWAAIRRAKRVLKGAGIPHYGVKLAGSVYVLLLREAARDWEPFLQAQRIREGPYFARGRLWLARDRLKATSPRLFRVLWGLREKLRVRKRGCEEGVS